MSSKSLKKRQLEEKVARIKRLITKKEIEIEYLKIIIELEKESKGFDNKVKG